MPELSSLKVDRTSAKDYVEVSITNPDGTTRKLSAKEVKEYIKKLVFGGKSLDALEKQLIKDGIRGNQWEKRKRLMALLTSLLEGNIKEEEQEELARELDQAGGDE
jgi:hypothetical protein